MRDDQIRAIDAMGLGPLWVRRTVDAPPTQPAQDTIEDRAAAIAVMPWDRLVETVSAYKGKSVKFIGVCCSGAPGYEETDGIPAIKAAIKDGKYNITYGFDESGKIGKAFGAKVTPAHSVRINSSLRTQKTLANLGPRLFEAHEEDR